jgi:hypothetical protein
LCDAKMDLLAVSTMFYTYHNWGTPTLFLEYGP